MSRSPTKRWFNDIKTPRLIGTSLLLIQEQLSADMSFALFALMARSDLTRQPVVRTTGANLMDLVRNNILTALASFNTSYLLTCFIQQSSELAVHAVGEEGIVFDEGFHQHSVSAPAPRGYIQTGSYGAAYVLAILQTVSLSQGTIFAMSADKMALLQSQLLDGQRWMVTPSGSWDWQIVGRAISRPQYLSSLLPYSTDQLLVLDSRPLEMLSFVNEINGWGITMGGNRHFHVSDYMSHRRNTWMASWRGVSSRSLPSQ